MRRSTILAGCVVVIFSPSASATNTPCSGYKGGISWCQGSTFTCNDGSVSASKKNCSAYMGGSAGLVDSQQTEMSPTNVPEECSCRAGHFCVGPREGHFCITDSGAKSYHRN
ncbi:hypothetical protein CK218_12805 [Mesorhizobium sp. WSM3879]|nr:hypothetical protein CK218_12805 [Mesorhizobium sp. WSM3879]